MSKTNAVGWFEIYVDDLARAKKFYEEVFQVELSNLPTPGETPMEMISFPGDDGMNKYGAPGALVKMDGYGPSKEGTIIYFTSDDCADEESRVVKAGGNVLQPKTSIGEYGFMCLIADSEGNTIGIHSMV